MMIEDAKLGGLRHMHIHIECANCKARHLGFEFELGTDHGQLCWCRRDVEFTVVMRCGCRRGQNVSATFLYTLGCVLTHHQW